MTKFDEAMREAQTGARQRVRERFGREALLWLAVVPEWTEDLATACGFPVSEPLAEWVERSEAEGLCESRLELGEDGVPRLAFLMPAAARADVFAGAGTSEPAEVAAMVGARIAEAGATGVVARWAELACGTPYLMGDALSRSVNQAVAARDTPAILDWIAAGEALVPVFGGELASAVARAQRRLNLIYRARQDERALAGFVRREDQIAAVERLLEGPDDEWALHLVGLGGAGKTMLLRYVGTQLAGERSLGRLVVARVDFDYIPPSFPFEQPAELLVRLCDGLAQHVEDQAQEALLEAFVRAKRDADDHLGGLGGDPQERIMLPPLQRVLDAFAAFVASLGDRVLLVLDTCEELAKLHAGEAAVPSVEAMWLLMTETRRRIPGVRVLLAGRRLLAASDADGAYELLPGLTTSFADRPYLRTFEIRGFRRDEAEELLGRAGAADAALVEAILAGARELGRSPGVRGGAEGPAPDRYNPFDLNLYAAWVRENPGLRAEDVAGAEADGYIQARIVERLKDDGVDAALPAIAVLRRFDLAMLAPVLPPGVDARRTLAVLSEQEWVDPSGGHTPETLIVDVEPHLRARLERYCRTHRPEALARAADLAAGALADLLVDAPLEPLGVERADLALRLAPPREAARLWARLERRIVAEGRWEWAIGAATRLLADEEDPESGELRPRHAPVRAHLLATLLSALGHRTPGAPPDERWRLVREAAEAHPDEVLGGWLSARAGALLGGIVGDPDRAQDDWQREQLQATRLAAWERALDDPDADVPRYATAAWLEALSRVDDPIDAAGAVAMLRLEPYEQVKELWAALAAGVAAVAPGGGPWLDWLPPASLRDRVALEWLRAALDACSPLPEADDEALRLLHDPARLTVDGERFLSLWLLGRMAFPGAPFEASQLDSVASKAGGTLFAPVCAAHRRVPPVFVALARALVRAGDVGAALDRLREARRAFESNRSGDPVRAEAARAARLEIVAVLRRMRLEDRVQGGAAPPGADAQEVAELAAAEVLINRPTRLSAGLGAHERWRVTDAGHPALPGLQYELLNERGGLSGQSERYAHLFLDHQESQTLLAPGEKRPRDLLFDARWQLLREREAAGRTAAPVLGYGWARLLLRRMAVLGLDAAEATRALPARRLAEIALEEGELLALRLPGEARTLMGVARNGFAEAGDAAGELIAAIAYAGAALRAGDFGDGRRALNDLVRPVYERRGDLPPWDELTAAGETPSGWTGWVLRLVAYRSWADGRLESFGAAPELEPPTPGAPPPAPPAPAASARRTPWPARIALLAGWASLLALSLLFGTSITTGALVLGLAASLAAPLLDRRGWAGALYRLTIRVEQGGDGTLTVSAARTIRGVPAARSGSAGDVVSLDASGDATEVTDFVAKVMGGGRANPQVALHVDPSLSRRPWEARLLAFARDAEWRPGWAPDVARVVSGTSVSRLPERVAVVAPSRWTLFAVRPWERETVQVPAAAAVHGLPAARAALLVGAGVEAAGGARLLLDAERLASASEATVSAAAGGEELLLDPEAVRAGPVAVAIVFGTPGPLDPESAAPLRAFGAAVAATGVVEAVLVIPTLPPDVAAAALAEVTGGWPFAGRDLRRAARRARAAIHAGLKDVPDAQPAETALDVCLFVKGER